MVCNCKGCFLVKATTEAAAFWFRNNWLLFKRCLIKIVPQRRGGTRQIRLCATESPAGLNIHLCRIMATKRIVRFAVGKLTPRDPGTFRTGSDAHTEVNGTASYKTRPPPEKCPFNLNCGNDPSAGSPTETLLRLHLPLNGKV